MGEAASIQTALPDEWVRRLHPAVVLGDFGLEGFERNAVELGEFLKRFEFLRRARLERLVEVARDRNLRDLLTVGDQHRKALRAVFIEKVELLLGLPRRRPGLQGSVTLAYAG